VAWRLEPSKPAALSIWSFSSSGSPCPETSQHVTLFQLALLADASPAATPSWPAIASASAVPQDFRDSGFGILSDFDIRISDFYQLAKILLIRSDRSLSPSGVSPPPCSAIPSRGNRSRPGLS